MTYCSGSTPATATAAAPAIGPVLTPAADGLRLRIHVTPRAGADRIGAITDDGHGPRLRIHVTSAPHDGQANAAVIRLLARTWRLPKTALRVVSGAAGRNKTIAICGDAGVLDAKLASAQANTATTARGRR